MILRLFLIVLVLILRFWFLLDLRVPWESPFTLEPVQEAVGVPALLQGHLDGFLAFFNGILKPRSQSGRRRGMVEDVGVHLRAVPLGSFSLELVDRRGFDPGASDDLVKSVQKDDVIAEREKKRCVQKTRKTAFEGSYISSFRYYAFLSK